MTEFTDISYEVDSGLAWITIARPERMNAFRARTVDELIHSFTRMRRCCGLLRNLTT